MQELFRSFSAILGEFEENDQVREALVLAAWRRNAGELLNERSAPVRYSGNRLVVAVADETWRKQMSDLSGKMMFKLNAALGEGTVKFIEFQVDEKAVTGPRAKRKKKTEAKLAAFEAIGPELMRSAAAITSEDLRTQFLLAANARLSRPE